MIKYFSVPFPVYVGVVTSQKSFDKELKRLRVKERVTFISEGAAASTNSFVSPAGEYVILVGLQKNYKNRSYAQVASLVVHEAVHVWQSILEAIREKEPGREIEAHMVQYITQCCLGVITKK